MRICLDVAETCKARVTLVNTRDKLLAFLGRRDHRRAELPPFGKMAFAFCTAKSTNAWKPPIAASSCILRSGKKIKSDVVLWANGRTGNTDDMGLECAGIVPNRRGTN